MLAIERKNEILDKLRAEQRVLVSDLAAYYHVTEETIRRDLDKLEKEGYATKTYGGAVVSVVENPGNGYDDSVDYDALAGTTITVAATPTPHAEVLSVAKEILAAKDITLDIKEFTDYVQPNNVVESGEIDANYFQHVPYLDDFNAENGTHLVSVLVVHVEPMGLYGGKQTSLDALNK